MASPRRTTGSLYPTFVPGRLVCLTVKHPYAIADLMLYYVEQGCSLTAQYGDYDEPFYTALENNFNKAVKFISSNGLMSDYSSRMKKMIESVECCGYGFPDTLWNIYYEYAED